MAQSGLKHLQALLIDMDGVLYRHSAPIPGGSEFLRFLRQVELPFLLVTNNSTLTVEQYAAKLMAMGIDVAEGDILTSSQATALYLTQVAQPPAKVFVIGENGIRTELERRGFVLTDDVDAAYVVVGLDRRLTYGELTTAALAIRAGAKFIGTNPDKALPTPEGLLPGAGAILAALQATTDVAPLVIGKPQPTLFELALQRLQAQPGVTGIVGDGLETDILGGRRLGLMTILVLSGVTSPEQLENSALRPDWVYADVAAVHKALALAMAAPKNNRRGRRRMTL